MDISRPKIKDVVYMDNYCIKVKRRGFNYYTDYMEQYFEKVAVNHGFHLTKRQEQAELWCLTFTGEPSMGGSKWITFTSVTFSEITYEQLEELSRLIAECFKSESIIEPMIGELEEITQLMIAYLKGERSFPMTEEQYRKYGTPNLWLFSQTYSAFDEPPFITEGETALKIVTHPMYCVPGENFLVDMQNYGGISRGLIINISFDCSPDDVIEIENLTIIIPNQKDDLFWQRLSPEIERKVENGKCVYRVDMPNFNIPEGVNVYSTNLYGKKKHDENHKRSFSLMFVPQGNKELLRSMEIEIIPVEYPANKVVLKTSDLKW